MVDREAIRLRWEADGAKRDERGRRLFVASETRAAGWGGLAAVSEITGIARQPGQVRRKGGGARRLSERDATLLQDLRRLVEPATLGDPVRPLLWVSKSLDKLATGLAEMGHAVSPNSVRKLLTEFGYSRQANRKSDEGSSHPDRDAQFEYINAEVLAAQAAGQPVISVDTKKKELVGNYRNAGREWRPKGDPRRVKVHDFEDKQLGKVAPYGVYDVTADAAWVSVGNHPRHSRIRGGLGPHVARKDGPAALSDGRELTITADCGGSNGARLRLWKLELQKFADETGLTIKVRHYPPGTSKWNKIEHRLFCHITQNWRARPLTDRVAVVELIAATTTKTGLKVESALDTRTYRKGIKVTKAQMKSLDIRGDKFHPEWNYAVIPRKPNSQQL
jgi:Rhodopirellula transposase DDE domain